MGYFNCTTTREAYYLSLANRPRPATASSPYRGVTRTTSKQLPWRAALGYRGARYYLGMFATELEAAKAYNDAALRIIGDHAVINPLPE
jgi:hypothetical protein